MARKELKGKDFFKNIYYPGGNEALKKFITSNLKYPKAALENRAEGSVHIKYDINQSGKVFRTKAMTKLGHGLEEEAIRLVRLLKFSVPKNRGMKITFHKDIHIHFKLPKQQIQNQPQQVQQPIQQAQYQYIPTPKLEEEEPKPEITYTYRINL